METQSDKKQRYESARKQVKRMQLFYIHLAGYLVLLVLLSYNFYILEEGPYKANITALNLSIIVGWTVFIALHAWRVFREKKFFKKEWEDRKIKEYLEENDEETTLWE